MMTNNNVFLPLYVSIHNSIVRLWHISSSVVPTMNKSVIYYIAGIQNVDIIKLLCFFFHSLRVDECLKLLREVKDRKKK